MRKTLKLSLKNISCIEDVLQITVKIIEKIKKKNPNIRIGYVSGKVTADGLEHITSNLLRMHGFTRNLEKMHGKYIFSAADIFNKEIYWKINLPRSIHEKDFYDFWRSIVSCGVTDIYMTPEWEKSDGARNEHKIAKELGINIHYL